MYVDIAMFEVEKFCMRDNYNVSYIIPWMLTIMILYLRKLIECFVDIWESNSDTKKNTEMTSIVGEIAQSLDTK